MTYQRAEEARFASMRAGRFKHVATFALLAPLILSGCVSQKDTLTGTADITPQNQPGQAPEAVAATEAPKPVLVSSADGGPARAIVPSARPGTTAMAAASTPAAEKGTRVGAGAGAAARAGPRRRR